MSEDAGAGTGSPVSGSSEGVRGGEAGGCGEWPWRLLFMSWNRRSDNKIPRAFRDG
jgi:hypothetical protein